MSSRRVAVASVALIVLSACATGPIVSSTHVRPAIAAAKAGSLFYALPRIKSQLHLKKKGEVYSLQYIGDVAGPDPELLFALNYDASVFADDLVKVTTTADGLLSSIDVTNDDKRGAFLIQLAEVGRQAVKANALFDSADPKTAEATEFTVAEMLVDLTDKEEVTALNAYLAKKTAIAVSVQDALSSGPVAVALRSEAAVPAPATGAGAATAACSASVCFRPKLAYVVTIDDAKQGTKVQQMHYSPNHAPLMQLDISRASFVKRVTNIAFDKGMVTSISIAKPSEALAVAAIPVEILKAIVSIPAEIVQLKIDTTNKEKGLIDARKQLIDAQKQLVDAQKEAAEALSASTAP